MYTNARLVVVSVLAFLAVSGCASRLAPASQLSIQHAATPAPQPRVEATTVAEPEPAFDPETVVAAVHSLAPRATVGALVVERSTGAELVSIETDRPFRSASLVKLLVAIDALERGADDGTRRRIGVMLARSDDDIASALWVRNGGPSIVLHTAKRLGLTGTRPPRIQGRWGDVLLTAHDVARVYDYVLTRLPEADRALIVDALASAPRVAGDGFDQYFGIPDGLGGTWAIKQGWSDSDNDVVFHTSGLVGEGWSHIVVLLTEHPLGTPTRTATRSVTAGAKALSSLF